MADGSDDATCADTYDFRPCPEDIGLGVENADRDRYRAVWLMQKNTHPLGLLLLGSVFFIAFYLLIFVIAKQLVLQLASIAFDRIIDVSNLYVGMILSEHIIKMQQDDGKVHYKKQMSKNDLQGGELITRDPVGISAEHF